MMEILKKKYYRRIFGEIIGNILFALIFLFYHDGIARFGQEWPLLILILVIWISSGVYRIVPVVRDFSYIRDDRCERVTGEIVEHKRVRSGKHSYTYYPIIRDDRTLERIKLHLDYREAAVGRRYTILYLPHTKLATVEEEHFEEYKFE